MRRGISDLKELLAEIGKTLGMRGAEEKFTSLSKLFCDIGTSSFCKHYEREDVFVCGPKSLKPAGFICFSGPYFAELLARCGYAIEHDPCPDSCQGDTHLADGERMLMILELPPDGIYLRILSDSFRPAANLVSRDGRTLGVSAQSIEFI